MDKIKEIYKELSKLDDTEKQDILCLLCEIDEILEELPEKIREPTHILFSILQCIEINENEKQRINNLLNVLFEKKDLDPWNEFCDIIDNYQDDIYDIYGIDYWNDTLKPKIQCYINPK